jgi:uncharacterized protein YjbI with pentapeptide repeats
MAIAEHLAIIKRGVWEWNKWRTKASRVVPDLSGADLSCMVLYDEELLNLDENDPDLDSPRFADVSPIIIDLSDAYLHGTNLSGANLREAYFRRAKMSESNLSLSDLHGVNMSEADLSGADLRNSNLEEADLSWADLRGANLRPIRRDVEGSTEDDDDSDEYWEGTNVTGTNFCGADLRGADLRGMDLSKTRGLSIDQIAVATIDADTKLPSE